MKKKNTDAIHDMHDGQLSYYFVSYWVKGLTWYVCLRICRVYACISNGTGLNPNFRIAVIL